jgi:hypothetical protein
MTTEKQQANANEDQSPAGIGKETEKHAAALGEEFGGRSCVSAGAKLGVLVHCDQKERG